MPEIVVLVVGWLIFVFWATRLIPMAQVVKSWRLRLKAEGLAPLEQWPRVTIVVPARNEGGKVEASLRSLLGLDYPDLEIIAVDDRSTDRTGAIMDELAAGDRRLRVAHVSELPVGWLGKNHALHLGAGEATGDWLLFTDGDIVFQPDAVRLAVTYVEREKFDHLCLNPGLIPGGYWENALTCCFGLTFFAHVRVWKIPTPDKRAFCGIGAFNLIRRNTYEAVGGHERIRLDVLDDVHLGKLVKNAGFRQQFLVGTDVITVRWQDSLWGVIRGLEKNSFAYTRYSLVRLCLASGLFAALVFLPYAGAILRPDWRGVPFWLTIGAMHATYGYLAGRMGGGFWGGLRMAPAFPIACGLLIFTMWRSAIVTLLSGGVRWRETFYSLDELWRNQLP